MDLQSLVQQLRQRNEAQKLPSIQGVPQGGGAIGQAPTQFQGMQQPQPGEGVNPMAQLLRAGTAYNNASAGRAGAGLAGAATGGSGAGFGLGQPLVQGGMGGASYAAPAASGLLGLAPTAAAMAGPASYAGADFMDNLGLRKTSLPSQLRVMGDLTSGNFGGAWDNLKDSVKSIFSIF